MSCVQYNKHKEARKAWHWTIGTLPFTFILTYAERDNLILSMRFACFVLEYRSVEIGKSARSASRQTV